MNIDAISGITCLLLAESPSVDDNQLVVWLKSVFGNFYKPMFTFGKILIIIGIALLSVKIGSYIIKKIFLKRKLLKGLISDKKTDTMTTLLISSYRYMVYIIAIIIILTDVLKMTSILAAAGIGGIALGFGAQSLVKDVISGFFIVFEDQYAVGDLVTIENLNGTVEELELRVTKLRNFSGDLYIIPNGEIKKVINHTRGNKAVVVDIPVATNADLQAAFAAAEKVCLKVSEAFETLVEQPNVVGITELGKESLNMRIMAKTLPNAQWEVEREIRRLIQQEFRKEGIGFFDKSKLILEKQLKEDSSNG